MSLDFLEMFDGSLQAEGDRQLLDDVPSSGSPFALVDPTLRSWLWGFHAKDHTDHL